MKKHPRQPSSGLRPPSPAPASEGQIPAGEQLLDPKGVGQRLKLSPRTVSEMANDGRLPAYRIGIYLRFKWVEVEQHITTTCRVAAEDGGRKAEDGGRKPEWPQKNSKGAEIFNREIHEIHET